MLPGTTMAVPALSETGRSEIWVLAASLRSDAPESDTRMMPLASVVTDVTYFDCATPVVDSHPHPLANGAAAVLPVWNTSAMVVRHWLAAKIASDTLALIV